MAAKAIAVTLFFMESLWIWSVRSIGLPFGISITQGNRDNPVKALGNSERRQEPYRSRNHPAKITFRPQQQCGKSEIAATDMIS
jgi:hypothetical protein